MASEREGPAATGTPTDPAVLAALDRRLADRRLGRYELLVPVGRGGMGVVWAAREAGSKGAPKIVAVKTMLPALSSDPRFEEMFLAEGRLASALQHPNLCAIEAVGEQGGVLYLVLEWNDGDTLAALLAAHPGALPPEVAGRIVVDVARGLHAAHEAKGKSGAPLELVHRDVSPQNILIGRDGRSKITDFGVAKAMSSPETKAEYVKGKVRYMSPEQVYCETLDRRTDVFALGVVLYEATTGTHPFAGPTDMATLAKLAACEEADAPTKIADGYPPALERVVARAIAKDPEARFATMVELATALEEALGEAATSEAVARTLHETCGEHLARRKEQIDRAPSPAPLRGHWAASRAPWIVGGTAAAAIALLVGTWPRRDVAPVPPPMPTGTPAAAPAATARANLAPTTNGAAIDVPPSPASTGVAATAERSAPSSATAAGRAAAPRPASTARASAVTEASAAPTSAPVRKVGVLETRE